MNDNRMKDNKSTNPPENHPIVTGIIVFLLMALSLVVGVVAGPLISRWLNDDGVENIPVALDQDNSDHNHPGPTLSAAISQPADEKNEWYVCPMHPWVVQPEPGTCPICSMDLTPLDPERFSGEIAIDPVVVQNIGIRVKPVIRGDISGTIRSVGTVEVDETRIHDVNLKFDGWVEKTYIDFEGAEVRKGQKLLEIYSPVLYSTQQEFLLLWQNRDEIKDEAMLESARKRLHLFDLTDDQIEHLQENGSPQRTVTVYAPVDGFVLEKKVNPGLRVASGNVLYRIADLRKVWIIATVFEHQVQHISLNKKVRVTMPYLPGVEFTGRISYIYPIVEQKTREVRIRIELNNTTSELKPGMYADVEIDIGDGQPALLAPREAIINTGERKIAFISLGDGRFEPREVQTGRHATDGYVEVTSGIYPNESVVISGQFLLDSESRIRESLVKMMGGDMAVDQKPTLEVISTETLVDVPESAEDILSAAIDEYLEMQDLLYQNRIDAVAAATNSFSEKLEQLGELENPGGSGTWKEDSNVFEIIQRTEELAVATDLESARIHFGYVGHAFNALLTATGIPESKAEEVMGVRCGMFSQAPEGGIWLQRTGDVRNPFFGADSGMSSCSSEKWQLPVHSFQGGAGK
jgi:multidrug efflux pump subunit AcrA (membrane-fusion protein)